jgi:hypothetical protein
MDDDHGAAGLSLHATSLIDGQAGTRDGNDLAGMLDLAASGPRTRPSSTTLDNEIASCVSRNRAWVRGMNGGQPNR